MKADCLQRESQCAIAWKGIDTQRVTNNVVYLGIFYTAVRPIVNQWFEVVTYGKLPPGCLACVGRLGHAQ